MNAPNPVPSGTPTNFIFPVVVQRDPLLHFTLHVRQHEYETYPTPRVQSTLTPDSYG